MNCTAEDVRMAIYRDIAESVADLDLSKCPECPFCHGRWDDDVLGHTDDCAYIIARAVTNGQLVRS